MEQQIILAGIAIGMAVIVGFLKYRLGPQEQISSYNTIPHIQTPAEYSFFKVLEQAVGNTYYIFPQVRLSSILKPNVTGEAWGTAMNKISKKSVDFVLADKQTGATLLIIELDDSSHNETRRQERDTFVNTICKETNLPLLRIKNSTGYNSEQLREMIEKKLQEKISPQ